MSENIMKMGGDSDLWVIRPPLPGEAMQEILKLFKKYNCEVSSLREEKYLPVVNPKTGDYASASCIDPKMLMEIIIKRDDRRNAAQAIKYYLELCHANRSLILVDPYLFPNNVDASYLDDLINVLEKTVKRISEMHLYYIQMNTRIIDEFRSRIKAVNSNMSVMLHPTEVFHDRLWITDRKRGFIVGTSLNGVGKRVAAMVWLGDADIDDILQEIDAI